MAHKKSSRSKYLRRGSRIVKKWLMQDRPYCDICGATTDLQLHHIYLIRHGFPTALQHCTLLCSTCHRKFHQKYDKFLDEVNERNHYADFLELYKALKKTL